MKGEKVLEVEGCVDDPFEKAPEIKVCLLRMKDITEKDAAVYTCMGRNAHGCTYSKLDLKVKGLYQNTDELRKNDSMKSGGNGGGVGVVVKMIIMV